MRFPDLERVCSLQAHTANCYCIEFDPSGRYFAAGSADALVSLWSADDMVCLRTFGRLEYGCCVLRAACCCCYLYHAHSCCSWPIRTLSFSCDSSFIASASEDLVIDIVRRVDLVVSDVPCSTLMHAICSSVTRRDWRVGLSDCMQGRNEHGRVASVESVARVRRRREAQAHRSRRGIGQDLWLRASLMHWRWWCTIPSHHSTRASSINQIKDRSSVVQHHQDRHYQHPPTRSNPIKARTEPHYLVGGFIAALCVADVGSRSSLAFTASASAMNALACSDCGSIAVKGAPAFQPAIE